MPRLSSGLAAQAAPVAAALALAAHALAAHAPPPQPPAWPPTLSAEVRQFVSVDAPVVALTHVRVIDGTGAPAREDQTVVIERGVIRAVGDAARVSIPSDGVRVLDLTGRTVLPGLVMLHEHMFYSVGNGHFTQMLQSFPPLYLAGGVTTARTGGTVAL